MLENLIGTLESEVGGQIASQTNLPANSLDKVFSVTGNVAKKEVTSQMLSGRFGTAKKLQLEELPKTFLAGF